MVDFQERDTRRGMDSLRPEGSDDEQEEHDEDHEQGHRHDRDAGHDHDHSHGHHAHDLTTVRAAVVTISSSRSLDDDPAGDAIAEAFKADGHEVITRELIRDSFDGIQRTVDTLVSRDDVDVVVSTGGTGASPDDVTPEAVKPLFEKPLPGFGELFRSLSFEEVGTRVVGTRAIGGIADGVPVFCVPGSENAARLGIDRIILPEAGHLAGLATVLDEEETEE